MSTSAAGHNSRRPKGVRARLITHHIRKEEQLNLAYGYLKEEDCPTISEALHKTRKLTLLDLRGNDRVGDAGAKLLAEGLKTNRTVTTLDLSDCHISDEGLGNIAEALKVNKTLQKLLLGLNPAITSGGAEKLAEALKKNKSLRSVSLYRCNIGDEGAVHLSEAIRHNTTLEFLSLFHNNIGNEGAVALAEAIKPSTRGYCTVQKLSLRRCGIGEEGVTALGHALRGNESMRQGESSSRSQHLNQVNGMETDYPFHLEPEHSINQCTA